ncbi:MAG: hypothetical protein IPL39_14540 [Opitutaceae bacterium]|nr:hypothetical protein [Opitutaceae bacterium]
MPIHYRPTGGYYRRAIRAATSQVELEEIAFALVRETENLRTWARALGFTPPHFEVTPAEAADRGGEIIAIEAAINQCSVRAYGAELIEPVARGQR